MTTNVATLANQILKYEGYAKSARHALKAIRKEAEADAEDGAKLAEAQRAVVTARERYKQVLRSAKAAAGNGEDAARIDSEESTIRESKEAIRDLKRKAKESGVNLKALSVALALKRLDPDVVVQTFDDIDAYLAQMGVWSNNAAAESDKRRN